MLVSSEEELIDSLQRSEDILLESDIHISDNFNTVLEYTGIFDGGGYTIYDVNSKFINTIKKDTIFRNTVFENVRLENDTLIGENNGEIKSIVVKDFESVFSEVNSALVDTNKDCIVDCTVMNSEIVSSSICGVICGMNLKGKIKNCACVNTTVRGNEDIGGICGKAMDAEFINCYCENSDIIGRKSASGICGKSRDSSFVSNEINNVSVDAGYIISGVISKPVRSNSVKNCSITNSEFSAVNNVNLIRSSYDSESKTENCVVKNCIINVFDKDSSVSLLSDEGSAECCTVEDVTVNGIELDLFTDDLVVRDSSVSVMVNAKSIDDEVKFNTTENLSISVQSSSKFDSNIKDIHTAKDLSKINRDDTVRLQSDINLGDKTLFDIAYFDGTFDGNGYTIYNSTGPLFKYFGGTMKDITIRNSNTTELMISSYIARSAIGATFDTVKVISDTPVTEKCEFSGFTCVSRNSEFRDCLSKIQVNSQYCKARGFCSKTTDCVFTSSSVVLDFNCCTEGSGFVYNSQYSEFSKCTSKGVLTNKKEDCAGIVNSALETTIINCTSNMCISSSNSRSNVTWIGGICGNSTRNSQIKNCEFSGSIYTSSSENYVGGIVGSNESEIISCVNTGEVDNFNGCSGGIAGESGKSIHKSKNNGEVTGETSGGLIGLVYYSHVSMSECQNTGVVTGAEIAGGLIGEININNKSEINLKNCYTVPNVNAEQKSNIFIGKKSNGANINTTNLYWKSNTNDTEYHSQYGTGKDISKTELKLILQM